MQKLIHKFNSQYYLVIFDNLLSPNFLFLMRSQKSLILILLGESIRSMLKDSNFSKTIIMLWIFKTENFNLSLSYKQQWPWSGLTHRSHVVARNWSSDRLFPWKHFGNHPPKKCILILNFSNRLTSFPDYQPPWYASSRRNSRYLMKSWSCGAQGEHGPSSQ